ncbi:arylsulfatase [Undibacterium sp. Di27W]|uniref:arylsulfatase n=1 Tax=Undibacterium sp. Di27W TaxID=3413036 RepID=UPI003BF25625
MRIKQLLALLCISSQLAQASEIPPAPSGSAGKPSRPNIVVLLADDWGFSDVGAFGSEIATPNLDTLARQGMRFSNFHVTASCSPTRSMLLTGVDNHLNGVGNMRETIPQEHEGKPGYLSVLNDRVVTVASLLKDAGYRTYVAGKWHVGKERHNLPDQRGFERSIIQGDSGSDNWETGKRYLDLTDKVYWFEDGKEAAMPREFYSSEYYVDRMINYIQHDQQASNAAQPFFAYVAFQANHIPVQAPRAFIEKYKDKYKDGWTALRQSRRDRAIALGLLPKDTPMVTMSTTKNWDALTVEEQAYQARRMEVYAAMAEAMDYHVGRLITALKKSGQYDNTVFMFMSDNGAEASDPYAMLSARLWLGMHYDSDMDKLGDKGAYSIIGPSWSSAAASPLSTYKFYAGEGGIRVPLIIAGKDIQQNSIQQGFTHINDIAPTILELANVAKPAGSYHGKPVEIMRGSSLIPVLYYGQDRVHAPDENIGYELSGNQALFRGDYKLVKNLPPVGDGLWHLYDIRLDPGETRDLQSSLPEMFSSMQAAYAQYAKDNGVLPMPDGYEPSQQIFTNAMVHVYIPRYKYPAILLLLGLVTLTYLLARRRRPSGNKGKS